MSSRVMHKRIAKLEGWQTDVYTVVCGAIWVSRSTDNDSAVTCKRCLARMRKAAERPKQ